ncbi:unnamed protein product [Didymodactylos carnosus]|uniref:Uncharacterized protein n=1 Tax=Didymodactylos carnosus TaxID=1234261 RepID=A0A813VDV9_9BILA|nr:unnamed protein product [Didymodactylos carnosus]CAF1562648.1 unnamed protein product [Didymodactylos carnosus]CAF3624270.1 unnamed protein product [Didymodactylos carnosus]CAF4354901.1 unnamed protein product [Didymodactylos carnosus]
MNFDITNQQLFELYARITSTPKSTFEPLPLTSTPIKKRIKPIRLSFTTSPCHVSGKIWKQIDLKHFLYSNQSECVLNKQQRRQTKYYSTKMKLWIV